LSEIGAALEELMTEQAPGDGIEIIVDGEEKSEARIKGKRKNDGRVRPKVGINVSDLGRFAATLGDCCT
jgi:hypothetical protein